MTLSRVAITPKSGVATEHLLASLAGYEAMRLGGNGFDAVVAASFSLAVVQPHLGGLGSDFFALFLEAASGRAHCINSSGWAPSGSTLANLARAGHRKIPLFGAFSVVVPGLVRGVQELHRRFGRLDFGKLLKAPIEYAEEGFPASLGSRGICRSVDANLDHLPDAAKRVFAPGGAAPKPGDTIRQPNLGRVLRAIEAGGADAFYDDWIAQEIRDELSKQGVEATEEDFSRFRPEWVTPLSIEYHGSTVYEVPPNSMGATTLLMLRYLEQAELSKFKPNSAERVEATLEAAVAAYRRRDKVLGDPRFAEFNEAEFLRVDEGVPKQLDIQQFAMENADTTYFAVTDREGNIVSAIQSLFNHFGSRVYVEKAGIFLNNRGIGFKKSGPNKLEPRKRPLHTLSALLIGSESEPSIGIGCNGGELRPQQHALFVSNLVDYSMSLEDAIDYPRFLWDGAREVVAERGYRRPRKGAFKFRTLPYPGPTGVAQAVEVLSHAKKSVCDVRGGGVPVGD